MQRFEILAFKVASKYTRFVAIFAYRHIVRGFKALSEKFNRVPKETALKFASDTAITSQAFRANEAEAA